MRRPAEIIELDHRASGLTGWIVLDDLSRGPAAGGVRTRRYASKSAALGDARKLARAMTLKCALADLPAGGAKAVVIDHDQLDRPSAFDELGRIVASLDGRFYTAGDLGTTSADLQVMAQRASTVYTAEADLTAAAGRGLLRCVEACARVRGRGDLSKLSVAIQGAGAIGAAAAKALATAGMHVGVADLDAQVASRIAASVGGQVIEADEVFAVDVDVVSPCAIGGVVTDRIAEQLVAWAVCGAANNILAGPSAEDIMQRRDITFVPDPIASAGAVIEGIGVMVMKLDDRTPLIDRLGDVAETVLREARASGRTATQVAISIAEAARS